MLKQPMQLGAASRSDPETRKDSTSIYRLVAAAPGANKLAQYHSLK